MARKLASCPTPTAVLGAKVEGRPDPPLPRQTAVERIIAVSYGWTYDAIVRRFPPYTALLDEVAGLVARSSKAAPSRPHTKVLDVSCGIGTVARRLARDGYSVVGADAVKHLVTVARETVTAPAPGRVTFHHADVAKDAVPGAGSFDVLVSMHTLYWHPDPAAFLDGCRRALRPGGHAIFLTYARPAHVLPTFRAVRAHEGTGAALRALRWLVPTALFERFRECDHRYLTREEFHGHLRAAGFEVLESRATFLDGISLLAWARHGAAAAVAPRTS
ncbi:MAG TPA: methyltransferase domain-containing protein [Methylomirabilota bacterium]|jgi:SAM-dependent methyltransferase